MEMLSGGVNWHSGGAFLSVKQAFGLPGPRELEHKDLLVFSAVDSYLR